MNNSKNLTSPREPITFKHKIGSTLYQVNMFFDTVKSESFEDKILRMMKNDLKNERKSGTISLPQADWLSERGSI